MNIELLISLIKDRPVLWDKTHADYKMKDLCRYAWIEICKAFVTDFETMKPAEQEVVQVTLTKKWHNVRDSWLKWRRKLNSKKRVRKYIYSKQLEFLDKINYDTIETSKMFSFQEISKMNNPSNVQPNLSVPDISSSPVLVPNEMDIELLICMIRDRPVLWDKSCTKYKSKEGCRDAWVEICNAVIPNYETTKLEEQEALQATLMKKWISIRDSWLKWRRRLNRKEEVKNSCHSEKLDFLNTIDFDTHDSLTNIIQSQETSQMSNSSIVQPNLSVPAHPSSSQLDQSQSSPSSSVLEQSLSPPSPSVLERSISPPSPSVLVQPQSPPSPSEQVQSHPTPTPVNLQTSSCVPPSAKRRTKNNRRNKKNNSMENAPPSPSVLVQSHPSPTPVHLQTSSCVPPSAKRRAKRKCNMKNNSMKNAPPSPSVLVQSQSPPSPSVQVQSHPTSTLVHLETSSCALPFAKRRAKNNSMENENRHLSFFKSILPSVACFNDDETLEFQMGMLSAIQIIKMRRKLKKS